MEQNEKAKEIYNLLDKAWLLAYKAEKESTGEEFELFFKIGMAINKAKCECHPGLK